MDHIRALRTECAADAFDLAMTTVATLLHNVLERPEEQKFRTVRLANATFHQRLGRFPSGLALLRSFGFEDAMQDESCGTTPTHLALPETDAAQLAQGLVLVEAARQAGRQVAVEQQLPPSGAATSHVPTAAAAAATDPASRASGKRVVRPEAASAEPTGKRVAPMAASSAAAGSSSSTPSAETTSTAASSTLSGESTAETAAELESFSAASIDAYFVLHLGERGSQLAGLMSEETFERLVTTARDARQITAATADAEAEARALYWLTLLAEHGALNGWADADEGEEGEGDQEEGSAREGDGAAAGAFGATSCGGASSEQVVEVAEDGNFDECAICGGDGSLICCDACPQAYHIECLGDRAPPEDDDEERAWYCPPCAVQLGMA